MSTLYDLHSHSTASDGTLSPTALVQRAAAARVDVLALTDHDSLDGLEEAECAALAACIQLVPGVEISVTWQNRTLHILGLGVDYREPRLRTGLAELQAIREWRAREMGLRLARAGIPGAMAGAERFSSGRIIARTHFARYLVEQGRAANVGDVFKHYLKPGKPGYVASRWADLEAALGWILGAGGVPVIAHPARYRLTRSKLRQLLNDFKAAGGLGMEVVSGSHTRDETLNMAAVSREHDLLASQGSDFHGPDNPWIELGRLRALPAGCTAVWERGPGQAWLQG